MKAKKNKKKVPYIFFGLVVAVVLLLALAYFYSPQIETREEGSEETETLSGLSQYLAANAEVRDYLYSDWIDESGIRIPLKGKQILLGTNGINGVGKYGNFTTDELDMVNADFLTSLQTEISGYFDESRFARNDTNTDLTPNDLYFSTLGYEKGDIYCLSHLSAMSDPFGYITCGAIDAEQLSLQKELSSVLENTATKDLGDYPVTFRVNLLDGSFANGSVSSIGGYQWIAKKANGTWETIWTGQDFPLCSDMEKYQVPSTMYPGCYNPETQDVQKSY